MSAGQLWLFPPPRPLVERLGEDFFHTLPTGPGVYLLCGQSEGVLYVGKARNLRKRLSSYRVANPERMPRRMIRLLHRVTRIEWDECASEEAARSREEALICVLMPKFNAAGKAWPVSDQARNKWKERLARIRALSQTIHGVSSGRAAPQPSVQEPSENPKGCGVADKFVGATQKV